MNLTLLHNNGYYLRPNLAELYTCTTSHISVREIT